MAKRLANRRRLVQINVSSNNLNYNNSQEKIQDYKKKVKDEKYIKSAVDKIAQELTYFLLK